MASHADFPLPLSDEAAGAPNPWASAEPEPTNLIALWPSEASPAQAAVLSAFAAQCDGPVEILAQPPSENDSLWVVLVSVSGHPAPLVVWAETVRPMAPELLNELKASSIKWIVGIETILIPSDPLAHLVQLLRLLSEGIPGTPAILDVNKEGWHTRQELDTIVLRKDAEPSESLLWLNHAVCADQQPNEHSKARLYTKGLARCSAPELEMLDVPYPVVSAGLSLLNHVGELIIEQQGAPEPGRSLEVGPGLEIVLQPWQEVAPFASEGSPYIDPTGSVAQGARAVICATEPLGAYRKLWVWPSDVMQHLASGGETVLYKTRRATARQAHLARETWSDLVSAFDLVPGKLRSDGEHRQAVFLVKAGLQRTSRPAAADGLDEREHLWFEVRAFRSGLAECQLLNEPTSIAHVHKGDTARIDCGMVWDWQVLTPRGVFGPASVESLRHALQQIVGAST